MNKNKKLIPELRFPEFRNEGEWVKNKVDYYLELLTDFEANGSFADVKSNVTIYEETNYAWYVRATDLENNSPIEKVKFVDQKSYEFLKKTSLFGGELLITKRGEIGKVYYFNPDNNLLATVAPNLYLLKFNRYAVPKFFYFHFITSDGNNSLKQLNASSTIGALYKDDVKNIQIPSPSIKEQQKIADCLSSIDEVITAHSQKLKLLKDHKKGLMQSLFPKKGEKVPKYRFKEFVKDGEWVENKLGDLGQLLGGGTPDRSNSSYWIGDIPWISSSDIKEDNIHNISITRFINKNAIKESATKVIPKGSVLFVSRVGVGKLAINKEEICTSQDFTNFVPKKDVLNFFIAYYFSSNKNLLQSLNQGTSIKGFSKSDLESIKFPYPKAQQEQQKIASCLSTLDEIITAQAEKLEQLKLHKKGLMQGLFPKMND